MKVLVAGATGAIGRPLVPQLVNAGHEVVGLSRSQERAAGLTALGARGIVADALDRERLCAVLLVERPEVVIHELTDLPKAINPRDFEKELAGTNRLRIEGTRNLVNAARAAGTRRIIAQSVAFLYAPEGDWIKSEDAPLGSFDGLPLAEATRAVVELEHSVLALPGIEGVVLRYGYFCGPGTSYAQDGSMAELVRRRRFPIIGKGQGVFSFIHVQDAAGATVQALEAPIGIYNIVDDEPASLHAWLPVYAQAVGAKDPYRIPRLVARVAAGPYAVYLGCEQRGASNAKAKRDLGWTLRYPTWRTYFQEPTSRGADTR